MKNLLFINIPMKEMKKNENKLEYKKDDNHKYKTKVIFPINAILGEILKKEDTLKIIFLVTKTGKDYSDKNIELYKEELKEINKDIHVEYETIESSYQETIENNEIRIQQILSKIDENQSIYADITYGQKSIPILLICALTFAEKFYNCDIKQMIYGKVEYNKGEDGKIHLDNPQIYDVTHLYYLNSMIASMEAPSGKDALQALSNFFSM